MDDLLSETFDFDVDTYATLIDVRVQIECHGERNYSGRVYTVDPLTQRFERKTYN
jgi:small nuclear ribonucleoprotein (snRNP)-like protein